MESKESNKKIIHPLMIKDANYVLFFQTIMICILMFLYNHTTYENDKMEYIILGLQCIIMIGIIHGLLIAISWLVAIVTGNVIYSENKPKEKGKQDADHSK